MSQRLASSHDLDIDWTRCEGHGLCAALLPGRISRDEWGYPIITGQSIRPAELRAARRAVALCPALALRLSGAAADDRPGR
jgi:ferredoxin